MYYQVLRVVEAIPYKSKKEKNKILKQYYKNSIIEVYDNFIYIERIEIKEQIA